jgi:hypothetical protein
LFQIFYTLLTSLNVRISRGLEEFHSLNLAKSALVTRIRKDDWSRAERYAAAPAEPCYELYTGRGGATRPTRHRMMPFCWTFGALVPCERQGCQSEFGRARDDFPPAVWARAARGLARCRCPLGWHSTTHTVVGRARVGKIIGARANFKQKIQFGLIRTKRGLAQSISHTRIGWGPSAVARGGNFSHHILECQLLGPL